MQLFVDINTALFVIVMLVGCFIVPTGFVALLGTCIECGLNKAFHKKRKTRPLYYAFNTLNVYIMINIAAYTYISLLPFVNWLLELP